ncbi:MAG: alcohol dehydrogenase catalytic domain-containing protein [Spirochaetaceae bacterium]|nr:alcohol dehydrogenase catalytic domain-containing protein [Spirochaetaceae bacterium]
MKALYYMGPKNLKMDDIDIPKNSSKQYLIKVVSCGICGSDFEGYLGKTGRRTPPMIMGHEFSGTIESLPTEINPKYSIGQKVIVFPKPFCGECELCKKGLVNVCPEGICMGVLDQDGAMCEYVSIEEKYIIPFSSDMSFNTAAMTEPLAVAYRSVNKISDKDIQQSDYFIVIGSGTIGLLAVALLKYRGAKNIIVSDTMNYRLSIAKKMGATNTINPLEGDSVEQVRAITNSKMCDFSIEAVGIKQTANTSLDCLKIGGTAIWIGNAQKIIEIDMQRIVTTELTIKGNYVYNFEDFEKCVHLLENNEIDVSPVITDTYKFKDSIQAFKDLENNREGKKIKIILEMD